MKKLKYKGYTIRVYTDPLNFAWMPEQPFGKIPKNAKLGEEFTVEHMTGFTTDKDKTVRLLVHPKCKFSDVLKLVAHETGHLIEGGFKKNPPHKDRYFNLHEKKAEHYEHFTMDAYEISIRVFCAVGRIFKN